jgi:DNA-binding response OmpR family regulator
MDAARLRGPAGRVDPAGQFAGSHGTLLTVVPAHDGRSRLAIVGYLLPPEPTLRGSAADPAQDVAGPPASALPADLVVDRTQHRVLAGGRDIELLFQEFELLEFLTAHPYRAFSREQILAGAWASRQQATSRTVDVHIHRLRRKLGPGYGECLVTVRRVGSKFLPPPSATT